MVVAADQASPIAPGLDDEKAPRSKQAKGKDGDAGDRAEEPEPAKKGVGRKPAAGAAPTVAPTVPPTKIDLNGIRSRVVALTLPSAAYGALPAGTHASLYFLVRSDLGRYDDRAATLSRWTREDRT